MRKISKILFAVGIILVLVSLITLLALQMNAKKAQTNAAELVKQIEEIIPERTNGMMDTYTVMDMPVLQIDGKDFIAIVDIPAFGVKLPVAGSWDSGKVSSFPCRFSGTVYDGSLIVGGADQKGQFDFFDRIYNETVIIVTDMTGAEYTYTVSEIIRSDSAETDVLINTDADLTLFVRDAYSLEYIIVRCIA